MMTTVINKLVSTQQVFATWNNEILSSMWTSENEFFFSDWHGASLSISTLEDLDFHVS